MSGRVRQVGSYQRTALNTGWQLCEGPPADAATWLDIGAPGTVADALRRCGQWSLDGSPRDFDTTSWGFRTEFDAPHARGDRCLLGLDGLATLAEVSLNGQSLLRSDNMFVSHELDVAPLLRDRGNRLLLRFLPLSEDLARKRPRPRWRVPMLHQQQLRWLRTTLLGRTPGWSPPAAAVGPWRGVWLESRSGFELCDTRVTASVHGDEGRLDLACRIEPLGQAAVLRAEAVLSRGGQAVSATLARGADRHAGTLSVPGVALWWPHTHGEPCLYALLLRVWLEGAREPVEVDLGAVGFRTLQWQLDGGDFALTINGVPVFCRGACWTPLDPVSLHAVDEAYAPALAQVRDAGMNMLRVGGAMVYEADAFYDACDANGVLVWQDLMFANMDYPADAAFADSVRREVGQQLDRWQARPSMALMCGNSEGEQQAAMWGTPRADWAQPLFSVELPRLIGEQAPELMYWPSSAHGGAFPFQADAGTASYYGVGAYLRPLEDARLSGLRFASECLGFANVPEASTLARLPGGAATKVHQPAWKARSPRDLGAGWDFDDVRDHYLHTLFGVDAAALRYSDHERYLMLSRAASGAAMAEAFAQWRGASSSCRGALVWFWRDLWAGAGWGLIDDRGVPKACWWMLRRMLQPLFLAITDEGVNGLALSLANETAQALDTTLRIAVYRDGHVELMSAQAPLRLAPREQITQSLMAWFDAFADLSHAYRFGPRGHDLVAATLQGASGEVLAQHLRWFDLGAMVAGTDIGLQALAHELGPGRARLTVASERAGRGVHLEMPGWHASDNHFDLLPGQQRIIDLHAIVGAPARALGGHVMALNARTAALVKVAS